MSIQRRTNNVKVAGPNLGLMALGFGAGVLFFGTLGLALYSTRTSDLAPNNSEPSLAKPGEAQPAKSDPAPANEPSNRWAPEGFNERSDGTAFQWIDVPAGRCYSDTCYAMEVVSKDSCPNGLYVELTLLDESNVNVGYTNDFTSGLKQGETAQLVFNATAGSKARINKINCR